MKHLSAAHPTKVNRLRVPRPANCRQRALGRTERLPCPDAKISSRQAGRLSCARTRNGTERGQGCPRSVRSASVLTSFWLIILTVGLITLPIQAHRPSDSYLTITITNSVLSGQWDLSVRDLEYAIGLDVNDDGDITWGELQERQKAVEAYALSRLELRAGESPLPLRVTDLLVDTHADGAYAVLRLAAEERFKAAALEVNYGAFFDLDPQHRGLMRLEYQDETRAAIFSPDQTTQHFELSEPNRGKELLAFIWEGIWHIWIGFDHILFLLALLLPAVLRYSPAGWEIVERFSPAFINVLKIVTAFTVAHSLTLSLATLKIVHLNSRWVESVIAASVVLAAINNIRPFSKGRAWVIAFVFGLIHGFGFANVLGDLGLSQGAHILSLVGFNVGVELGQLAIVAVFLPLAFALRRSWAYHRLTLRLGSAAIAMVAMVWMFERMFDVTLLEF
ncbi:MAG: HupE/UreJ family protein [Verrucomicrobia bacterium]|nr:HupE/UreJ family protein [Verrucomicrobiota bacterium]